MQSEVKNSFRVLQYDLYDPYDNRRTIIINILIMYLKMDIKFLRKKYY